MSSFYAHVFADRGSVSEVVRPLDGRPLIKMNENNMKNVLTLSCMEKMVA